MVKRLWFVLFMLLACGTTARAAPRAADVIIRNAMVVDVDRARTAADRAIVIRGGDIVAVGPDARIAREWRAAR